MDPLPQNPGGSLGPEDPERAKAERQRAALVAVGFSILGAIATVACVFGGVLFFAFSICSR